MNLKQWEIMQLQSCWRKLIKRPIKQLQKALEKTEEQLTAELKKDSTIKNFYDLLTSVKGMAKVIAIYLIVYTKALPE